MLLSFNKKTNRLSLESETVSEAFDLGCLIQETGFGTYHEVGKSAMCLELKLDIPQSEKKQEIE